MPRINSHLKEENFNFRVPADLKAAFQQATEATDRPAAQVIRDFMRAYVNEHTQPEPGYDTWLRRQIQEAIDDTRPTIPHDTVMQHTQAAIERIINK